jgi:hypothetical protein
MKSTIGVCLFATFAGTLGCANARTGSAGAEPTRLMDGEFRSACVFTKKEDTRIQPLARSSKYNLRVTEGAHGELTEMSFSDDACQTLEYKVVTGLKISNDQVAGSARTAKFELPRLETTAFTENAAKILSEVRMNGQANYRVGEVRELDFSILPEFPRVKALYKYDGSRLDLTSCGSDVTCSSFDDALPFTRVSD